MSDSKIELNRLFSAVNQKNRKWWNTLNSDQQTKFGGWLYNRYLSVANTRVADLTRYYVLAVNQHVNRNFSALKRHPQLQYLLYTTVPFQGGEAAHQYVKPLPIMKKSGKDNRAEVLAELYTEMKIDDVVTWAELMTDDELREELESWGMNDRDIQKAFK